MRAIGCLAWFSLFLLLCGLPQSVEAQVLYGMVVGTVQDATGAVVPGAVVSVLNTATNQAREVVANELGAFTFPDLAPGSYRLTIRAPGFQTFAQTGISVTINTVTRVNVQMQVGELTETVTVAGQAVSLQSDKADVHVEITTKELADLPLPQYRNYQSLINLVPGSSPVRFQNAITDTPDRSLATNINGTSYNNNNTRVDGATNVMITMPHHNAYVPPVESIEAVNISTNAFDAEQGLAGGSAITVNTKSGTNQFHGVLFENHGNSAMNARNFFYLEKRQPKNIVNLYGATLGGPIRRDKLFFFTSWEAVQERLTFSRLHTVATADQRRGDFSAFRTRIYDPLTGAVDGAGRLEFPDAVIPMSRQSAITRKMLDLVPLPNQQGTASNFFSSGPQVFDRNSLDVKINWNKSAKASVFGKYSRFDALVSGEFGLGEAGGRCLCNGGAGKGDSTIQLGSLGGNYTFSATFLVDGTFGFTRVGQAVRGADYGVNFGLDVLGIPGTNGSDIRQSGKPVFVIDGHETLGNTDTWSPVFRADNSWTYTTNFSKSSGAHDMRFGVDIAKQSMNQWQPNIGGRSPRGGFSFPGGVTALRGGAATNQFNAMATFLLGLPQSFGKAIQFYAPSTNRQWLQGYYFRDRWQATSHLTITLGLRWEYYPMMTRAHHGAERYDWGENLVYIGGFGSTPGNAGWTTSKTHFAPRLGLAYRIGWKTVIRAGYGITIDPYPIATAMKRAWPSVVNEEFLGVNAFQPAGPIEKGIPFFTGPDIRAGVLPLPLTATTRTMNKGLFDRGYIESWNFFIERELPGAMTASAGYVGTRSIRQTALYDLNAAPPGGGTTGRPLYILFGRGVSTEIHTPFGTSNYNALQTSLNRRFHAGLLLKLSYTWSKTINFNDNSDSSLMFGHPSVHQRNRALAGYDRPHNFRFAYVAELPFGAGKPWANRNLLGAALLGGWQVNGIFSVYSGSPFSVSASGTSLNAPGNSQTADLVATEVRKLGGIGPGAPYFDPTAFRAITETRFGNTGRNILRGPGVTHLDLGLFRSFKFSERIQLQFRAEAFNLSNTPHFSNPAANVSGAGFMTITSTAGEDSNADSSERRIRLGLRLSW
jgi:hypothetical protein